jgi:hypothetical protein
MIYIPLIALAASIKMIPQRLNLIVVMYTYDKDDGMPATKPAASIVLVAVSVLVQYLLHSWFVFLQLVLYIPCWYH